MRVSRSFLFLFLTCNLQLATCNFAFSLPPFRSLFESKYGYKADCTLCHVSDDWDLNAYGKGFLKNGMDFSALSAMENIDIDKDGSLTLEEIKAKSNSGDPQSTPEHAGHWLTNIIPLKAPVKDLKEAFPDADLFETLERPLTDPEIARIKRSTPSFALADSDKFAVVFLAKNGEGVILGGSTFIPVSETTKNNTDLHVFILSANPNGKIIQIETIRTRRKEFKSLPFLKLFKDVWPEDLLKSKIPKGVNPKLALSVFNQAAKYAKQIDVVIAP